MKSNDLLRQLPRMDELIEALNLHDGPLRPIAKTIISDYLSRLREQIQSGQCKSISRDEIVMELKKLLDLMTAERFIPVINGTGVVLHTNLGRSTISKVILDEAVEILYRYNTLEYNVKEGKRGSRYDTIESLICLLTGAESAIVVNNNAAAVMLVLSSLASNREVIVSRGEMVEIGGSFRIPEVMKLSGALLKEIGTTNKTHLSDYRDAMSEATGLVMKVHTSNYKVMGFTSSVDSVELSLLCENAGVPVYEDLGSGLLYDLGKHGLGDEPVIQQVVKNGIDIISFSGDKLLGASQCGIILGKSKYIDKMKKNQLLRALRIDKFSLAVLERTLRRYFYDKEAISSIDTLRRLTQSEAEIEAAVNGFLSHLSEDYDTERLKVISLYSEVGGGAMPMVEMPSFGLEFTAENPNDLQQGMRKLRVPIVSKIMEDKVVLDFRTIGKDEYSELIEGLLTLNLISGLK